MICFSLSFWFRVSSRWPCKCTLVSSTVLSLSLDCILSCDAFSIAKASFKYWTIFWFAFGVSSAAEDDMLSSTLRFFLYLPRSRFVSFFYIRLFFLCSLYMPSTIRSGVYACFVINLRDVYVANSRLLILDIIVL